MMSLIEALEYFGLGLDYDEKSLLKAYRKKSKQCHPDLGGSDALFHEMQGAYDLLKFNLKGIGSMKAGVKEEFKYRYLIDLFMVGFK